MLYIMPHNAHNVGHMLHTWTVFHFYADKLEHTPHFSADKENLRQMFLEIGKMSDWDDLLLPVGIGFVIGLVSLGIVGIIQDFLL